MSEIAERLLSDIHIERNIRSNESNNKTIVFDKNTFIDKYNYNKELLNDLLHELKDYGYVEIWITGQFVLKED